MLYKSWEAPIKLFNDYFSTISEAYLYLIYKIKYEEGFKILTPKQMLQRLPIPLAQVKAGNPSENLLNEIRQIIYCSYRAKKLLRKNITILLIQ